ncbi:MAG: 2-oxoisovalerate dehydrogenase, partial [Planctomycetota bacterium]
TLDELKSMVLDAVRGHFDGEDLPAFVHLHIVQDEVLPVAS